jgi:ribosomal protein S18 acetylase RimI-like enzyme
VVDIAELTVDEVDDVAPLWGELLVHHQEVGSQLEVLGPRLAFDESWASRRAQYVDWFASAAGRLWLARADGVPVGYCFAHTASGSNTWDWGSVAGVLETLVVSPSIRGTGLGSELFALARGYFGEVGLTVMKISVMAGNDDALRLYRRLGAIDMQYTLVVPLDE